MPLRLTIRIRDEDLIRALERARKQGIVVNRLVNDALRRVLLDTPHTPHYAGGGRPEDEKTFWNRMRAVVEAAVASAIAKNGGFAPLGDADVAADQRAEALLDALGADLDDLAAEGDAG